MNPPSSHTALVVDDELPIRALLLKALEGCGFRCAEAANGEEARTAFQSTPFDVVVTDLLMPKSHGHSLCVHLCEKQQHPIIVVLTAFRNEKIQRDLKARGVDLVVHKPVNYIKFAEQVRDLVDQKLETNTPTAPHPETSSDDPLADVGFSFPKASAQHVTGLLLRSPERAELLSQAITESSTSCFSATSSEELCRLLDRQRIDLLIVENELGGFLSGLEIVERLNQQLIRPKIILLTKDPGKVSEKASDIGVEQVLDLNIQEDDLVRYTRTVLANQSEQDAFIPALARCLVKDFGEIPPLPQLVVKLAGYLSMPINDIPIDELANDISSDSRAATDLLNYTNMGLSVFNQTTSVRQAVNLNGPKKTIMHVLAAATMRVRSQVLTEWNESHRQWYQKRSVITAAAAATFAEHFENIPRDTAFILGLVQDIGCLVLSKKYGKRYDLIVKRFREVGRLQLHQLELETFKIHHGHVSAALMLKWQLPQSLIRPVVVHHDAEQAETLSQVDRSYLRVIQLGEMLADSTEVNHSFRNHMLTNKASYYDELTVEQRNKTFVEAIQYAKSLCQVFNFPSPDPAELTKILTDTMAHAGQELEKVS
ncbi:response regulator [Bremerella cremea]|uniref:Response regulator n=1 Tax=Bremerella cremea TaxID=1031537 RepID=A0A368KXH4_9BACT|nr:response regulator [Bremerella cremea]RCS54154.1 response regulator [Bremerella cremea]